MNCSAYEFASNLTENLTLKFCMTGFFAQKINNAKNGYDEISYSCIMGDGSLDLQQLPDILMVIHNVQRSVQFEHAVISSWEILIWG